METKIMRVVQQGDVLTVQSTKSEGGMLKKRNIILREMGGKFENTYAAVMLGTTAELSFGKVGLLTNEPQRKVKPCIQTYEHLFFFPHLEVQFQREFQPLFQ